MKLNNGGLGMGLEWSGNVTREWGCNDLGMGLGWSGNEMADLSSDIAWVLDIVLHSNGEFGKGLLQSIQTRENPTLTLHICQLLQKGNTQVSPVSLTVC